MEELTVRIVGQRLPGLRCGGRTGVHVGVQRGREVVALVPGDVTAAVFEFTVGVVTGRDGRPDFRGPFVHGRPGERFLYLSWGEVGTTGRFEMFRRAKLHLSALPEDEITQALTASAPVEASLDLTDECGEPVCASIRPPRVIWRVGV